jgi:hypothetical protein
MINSQLVSQRRHGLVALLQQTSDSGRNFTLAQVLAWYNVITGGSNYTRLSYNADTITTVPVNQNS